MATQEIKKGKPVDKEVIRKINELNQKGDAQGLWQLFKEYDIDPSSISADVVKYVNPIPADIIETLKNVINNDNDYKKNVNDELRNMTDKLFNMLESYNNNPNISEEERAQNTLQIYKQLDKIRDTTTQLAINAQGDSTKTTLLIAGGLLILAAAVVTGGVAVAAVAASGSATASALAAAAGVGVAAGAAKG